MRRRTLLALIGALPLAGCAPATSEPELVVSTLEPGTPRWVVRQFYFGHLDQLRQGQDPLEAGEYGSSAYLTEELKGQLDQWKASGAESDPFLCVEGVPAQFEIHEESVQGEVARVPISSQDLQVEATVELRLVDGNWLIDTVSCSR